MSESDIELIWKQLEQAPGTVATVSLPDRTVTVGESTYSFDVDDYTRWRLSEGLDDIGLTLRNEQAIEGYEQQRRPFYPATSPR